jgi:hypothetical protein
MQLALGDHIEPLRVEFQYWRGHRITGPAPQMLLGFRGPCLDQARQARFAHFRQKTAHGVASGSHVSSRSYNRWPNSASFVKTIPAAPESKHSCAI